MNTKLGSLIKILRQRSGYSQFELEIELDASAGSISRIENGLVNPTKETLKKIIKILDLNVKEQTELFDIKLENVDFDISPYTDIFATKEYARKWKVGEIKDLFIKMVNKIDFLELGDLLGFASINLELGQINYVNHALSLVKKKCFDYKPSIFITNYLLLIQAELAIINDNYELAKTFIQKILELPTIYKYSFLHGKSYFLLALIDSQNKNSLSGIKNLTKAIEYFDIFRYPIEIGRSYLYMTDFLEFDEQFLLAKEYYALAEDVFTKLDNQYLMGWCVGGKAFNHYIQGNINEAISISKSAIILDNQSGSQKQLFYSTSILAKSFTVQGNYREAYKTYEESLLLEKGFRKQIDTSTNNLYKLFIKAKSNPIYINDLEKIILDKIPLEITKQYLLFSAKYLFGENTKVKKSGELGLKNLAEKTNYNQFKNAIDKTLLEKHIQPVAI